MADTDTGIRDYCFLGQSQVPRPPLACSSSLCIRGNGSIRIRTSRTRDKALWLFKNVGSVGDAVLSRRRDAIFPWSYFLYCESLLHMLEKPR